MPDDTNWGWLGGAIVLVPIWLLYSFLNWKWTGEFDLFLTRWWLGKGDEKGSFSNFQFLLWLLVIAYCTLSLWAARVIADSSKLCAPSKMPGPAFFFSIGSPVVGSMRAGSISARPGMRASKNSR